MIQAVKRMARPGWGIGAVVTAIALLTCAGCPSSTGGTHGGAPGVDLAVGDLGQETTTTSLGYPKILLYFNVLQGGSLQDPAVVLSGESNPMIREPFSIVLSGDSTGNDLYVADNISNTVQIWRDYRNLVPAKSAKGFVNAPDVVLDCQTSLINVPFQILDVNDRLYVSNNSRIGTSCTPSSGPATGSVLVFDHASQITASSGNSPGLIFDVPQSLGIAVSSDTVYAASSPTFSKTIDTRQGAVYVFNDITGRLAAGNSASRVPSAVLSGPSFLNMPVVQPFRVRVFGNRLYVSTVIGALFVYDHADSLVDMQEPSAVISGSNGVSGNGADMAMVGDTLYVTGFGILLDNINGIGMTAFRPGHAIVTGQNAALSFDETNSQMGDAFCLANEGNTLFVATQQVCCSHVETGDVHIFNNADTLLLPGPGDLVLPALKDFVLPISIDSNTFIPQPTP